jgi:hypothetical protein
MQRSFVVIIDSILSAFCDVGKSKQAETRPKTLVPAQ